MKRKLHRTQADRNIPSLHDRQAETYGHRSQGKALHQKFPGIPDNLNTERTQTNMLKKIRTALAIIFFAAITLLFLDFTGTLHAWLGWMAKIQFLPAVLAINAGVVIFLVLLTLIFGRLYCSVICPLGIFQDLVSWINGRRSRKARMRFTYSPAKNWLRYGMLVLFIAALLAGIGSFAALLDPYSAYGRIASNLFAPLWQWGSNLLAFFAERIDSYAFYKTEVWLRSLPTFIIAAVTFIVIAVLAWKNGRTWCNTICPVGTVLGFISRFSLFKVRIDAEKCKSCSLCTRACKASCIDYKNHSIDHSRCVDCFDCLDTCTHGAIGWTFRFREKSGNTVTAEDHTGTNTAGLSRRRFLATGAALTAAATIKAQEKKVDGGLAVIEDKEIPDRQTKIVPAGAQSLKNFYQHCTACQLCVSVCPNQVLRPSAGLDTLMQPEMSYERGYCRPECTKCSEVCPAGAIKPVSAEEKSSIQIGHAVWVKENCIPLTDGVKCGNCARHCPTGAIQMVPFRGRHRYRGGREDNTGNDSPEIRIPVINTERCIGCGACENLCPARPFTAIYVEGNMVHGEI